VATAGTFLVDLVNYQAFLYLLGSFFVPLFGVLLAQWLAGKRDPFGAPEFRPAQILAWLAGFCLYQWLAPVGPGSWTRLVEHTHPGQGAIGGSLPSFALSFVLSLGLTVAGRAIARRHRPSVARPGVGRDAADRRRPVVRGAGAASAPPAGDRGGEVR
jgi:purine-cytosine permease-like protein